METKIFIVLIKEFPVIRLRGEEGYFHRTKLMNTGRVKDDIPHYGDSSFIAGYFEVPVKLIYDQKLQTSCLFLLSFAITMDLSMARLQMETRQLAGDNT